MKKWAKKDEGNSDDVWASWLTDDRPSNLDGIKQAPVVRQSVRPLRNEALATDIRRQRLRNAGKSQVYTVRQPRVQTGTPHADSDPKVSIDIQISKPSLVWFEPIFRKARHIAQNNNLLRSRRSRLILTCALSLLLVSTVGLRLLGGESKNTNTTVLTSFNPLLPKGKPQVAGASDAKLQKVDDGTEVLSFPDEFMGSPVVVSQQSVPEQFKSESDPAGKMAEQLGDTDRLTTAFGNMYVTKNKAAHGQTVILAYKGNLVLVHSTQHRSGEDWKLYVESLRP